MRGEMFLAVCQPFLTSFLLECDVCLLVTTDLTPLQNRLNSMFSTASRRSFDLTNAHVFRTLPSYVLVFVAILGRAGSNSIVSTLCELGKCSRSLTWGNDGKENHERKSVGRKVVVEKCRRRTMVLMRTYTPTLDPGDTDSTTVP